MKLVLSLALAALVSSQVVAQDCITTDALTKRVEEAGDKVVGGATYNGSQTEMMLIVEAAEFITLYGFNHDGCLVGAMVVEPAKKKDVGA